MNLLLKSLAIAASLLFTGAAIAEDQAQRPGREPSPASGRSSKVALAVSPRIGSLPRYQACGFKSFMGLEESIRQPRQRHPVGLLSAGRTVPSYLNQPPMSMGQRTSSDHWNRSSLVGILLKLLETPEGGYPYRVPSNPAEEPSKLFFSVDDGFRILSHETTSLCLTMRKNK